MTGGRGLVREVATAGGWTGQEMLGVGLDQVRDNQRK
jgi:hypothetical protein